MALRARQQRLLSHVRGAQAREEERLHLLLHHVRLQALLPALPQEPRHSRGFANQEIRLPRRCQGSGRSKYFDTSGVQTYIINGSRVIFLRDRPQLKPTKTLNACKTCKRACRDQFSFCSLRCKIKYCVSDPRGLTWDFSKIQTEKSPTHKRKRVTKSIPTYFAKCRIHHRRKQSQPKRAPVY